MQKWAKQTGFTIVELLIVVVVIAILASITVVAYTGISQRANNTQQLSTVENIQKALLNGITQGFTIPSSSDPICLGTASDYPAQDGFTQGTCARVVVDGTTIPVNYAASNFSTWTPGSMPSAKMTTTSVTTTISGSNYTYTARGPWLNGSINYVSGSAITLNWVPQVKGQCGTGTYLSNAICTLVLNL